jgi:hypothetical protein
VLTFVWDIFCGIKTGTLQVTLLFLATKFIGITKEEQNNECEMLSGLRL